MIFVVLVGVRRHRKRERCSLPKLRRVPDMTGMAADQGLDVSQPHPFSGNILSSSATKRLKYFIIIFWRNAAPIIVDVKCDVLARIFPGNFYMAGTVWKQV